MARGPATWRWSFGARSRSPRAGPHGRWQHQCRSRQLNDRQRYRRCEQRRRKCRRTYSSSMAARVHAASGLGRVVVELPIPKAGPQYVPIGRPPGLEWRERWEQASAAGQPHRVTMLQRTRSVEELAKFEQKNTRGFGPPMIRVSCTPSNRVRSRCPNSMGGSFRGQVVHRAEHGRTASQDDDSGPVAGRAWPRGCERSPRAATVQVRPN
jgi:hypothetical protein